MISRRQFLQLLGAGAAAAALPSWLGAEKIAVAKSVGPRKLWLSCAPLEAGKNYTFSAYVKRRSAASWERIGLLVTGVEAKGGETMIEVPIGELDAIAMPQLSLEPVAVYVPTRLSDKKLVDFTKHTDRKVIDGAQIVEFVPRTNVLLYTQREAAAHGVNFT